MGRLDGKVAIVTGAARGMGESHARLFAEEGACVVVADIRDELGRETAASIGERAVFARLDVANEGHWAEVVEMTVERFGGLDVLVNNAGGGTGGPIDVCSMEDYHRIIGVNMTGVWLGVRAVIPAMRARGGGSIVNVGSRASAIGIPGSGAYSAAKFGVRGITRTAALENAEHGIRVNMIYPGLVHTPIFDETPVSVDLDEILARERWFMGVGVPMGRRGKPSEVSPLVVFLASDESSYVTGVEIPVDGGMLAGATASGIHEIRGTGGALDEAMAT